MRESECNEHRKTVGFEVSVYAYAFMRKRECERRENEVFEIAFMNLHFQIQSFANTYWEEIKWV
jgi:hypothetical protein